MEPSPLVTVVIVNLNTVDLLRECLRSLFADPGAPSMEVIVMDNGSTDGSVAMVRDLFPWVIIRENRVNEGFAAPNNAGIRQARGTYCLLLNSDTEVRPGALGTLVGFMESHPAAGACGPMLLNPDETLQRSVRGFPDLWTHAWDMLFLDRIFPRSPVFGRGEAGGFDYGKPACVDHLMAAAFLVRTRVFQEVGLLDEGFRIYYNDMDWCYRLRKAGREIWYVPAARVMHHLGKTVGILNRNFGLFRALHEDVMRFFRKHYGPRAVPVYRMLLGVGSALRTLLWAARRAAGPSDRSSTMLRYSWKTFLFACSFWRKSPP
ncbi:MAG: glycosyltransferase family 2 protein [Bacteroidota bacterium]